jgi:ubiquinone/menaquinone biosynthesis C-methylase UbiE
MSPPDTAPVVIDGGDRACIAMLLELRGHLTKFPPGTVIHLIARDPAAPLDVAAWCHLTGHAYLSYLGTVGQVGPGGQEASIDMTAEILARSRQTAQALGLAHVEFREGFAEALPVQDAWADVVISNGVVNLCADKQVVLAEIFRVLRPGGRLQFAGIANGRPVPAGVLRDIDLWTG